MKRLAPAAAVFGGVAGFFLAASATAAAPPPLSTSIEPSDISSTLGSGVFGTWRVDRFGLPAYRYTLDQRVDPRARQNEIKGATTTWHQVGNSAQHAFATNDGYTELWSQQRLFQWANFWAPDQQHYAGGFGFLYDGDKVLSTLWLDQPAGVVAERDFGVGYFRHRAASASVDVEETVYAPYGEDPVLLHDVTITNRSATTRDLTWWEYWDVNPVVIPGYRTRNTKAPVWDATLRTMRIAQQAEEGTFDLRAVDTQPLTIFAAPLAAPIAGFETDLKAFFGTGTRAAPAAVMGNRATNSIAPATLNAEYGSGRQMIAFRSPVRLAPGQSITLRYAYGIAAPASVNGIVARLRGVADPLADSSAKWRASLPQARFPDAPALARELQWSAYMLRARATREDGCVGRSVSAGGAFVYDQGQQGGPRDPMEFALSLVYADRALAKDALRFYLSQMDARTGVVNGAIHPRCVPYYFAGVSGDQYGHLLLGLSEYLLASRDFAFLDEVVPYANVSPGVPSGTGTVWQHVKRGFDTQESALFTGMHGLPTGGTFGDWADFSTVTEDMTESTMAAGLLAFTYQRLVSVAQQRGDAEFAQKLQARATDLLQRLDGELMPGGWYSRGYKGTLKNRAKELVQQPFAILAGAPDAAQATQLVANIRRYLTGVGAAGGPSKVGTALFPMPGDLSADYGSGDADPTGVDHTVAAWFAMDGFLTWAYATLDGAVPNAGALAWDELTRSTLANLATQQPAHWSGVMTVDDVCDVWWTPPPYSCGVFLAGTAFNTQMVYQPAFLMLGALKVAGIEPTATGFRIAPKVPSGQFSLRLPHAGIEVAASSMRGYLQVQGGQVARMAVQLPTTAAATAWVDGVAVPATRAGNELRFALSGVAGRVVDWAVSW